MLETLRLGNAKIATNLLREMVVDLAVARYGTAFTERRVMPPRVTRTFAQQFAAMFCQMPQQVAALHTAMMSSS